jgi:triacylglycerol esterase/lipase EstA (alpha/beta hydrolase family)
MDLTLLKNAILKVFPEHMVIMSRANQGDADCDIATMGKKLASEIRGFVQDWCPNLNEINKLSFIGHSLGGLVIRACLPYLTELYPKFHLYLSLSTPHFGYLSHNSLLVNTAMWIYKTWRSSRCLD